MDYTKTWPGKLKIAQLVGSVCAAGIMADIFDIWHGGPDSGLDKTNFGTVCAAVGLTLISLVISYLRLEQKSTHWKALDVQLHTIGGVVLLTGWGLYVYRVNDVDSQYRRLDIPRVGEYKVWFGKAVSTLVLEALVIPLYFVLPYFILKDPSTQDASYPAREQATSFYSQYVPPTTFHNQQAPPQNMYIHNQAPQQDMYGRNQGPPQQMKFYNQQQAQPQPAGYYNNQQQYPQSGLANTRPTQYPTRNRNEM